MAVSSIVIQDPSGQYDYTPVISPDRGLEWIQSEKQKNVDPQALDKIFKVVEEIVVTGYPFVRKEIEDFERYLLQLRTRITLVFLKGPFDEERMKHQECLNQRFSSLWRHFSEIKQIFKEEPPVVRASPLLLVADTQTSVKKLVHRFSQRPWHSGGLSVYTGAHTAIPGLIYSPKERVEDCHVATAVIRTYLQMFSPLFHPGSGVVGIVKRLDHQAEDVLFVRGDLHGDLVTLLAVMALLQEKGYLDHHYHCLPEFHWIFLGDYCDRGINDIEVMTLLLQLHIENPCNVHLIRGNHEDVFMRQFFVNQAVSFGMLYLEDSTWVTQNSTLLRSVFESMPLAIIAGEIDGYKGRREFLHMSHGCLSPVISLEALYNSSQQYLAVNGEFFPVFRRDLRPGFSLKKMEAQKRLEELCQKIKFCQSHMYQCGEIGQETAYLPARGFAYSIGPDDLHAYFQATENSFGVIKSAVAGHIHRKKEVFVIKKFFKEGSIPTSPSPTIKIPSPRALSVSLKKVIGTTLPTGTLSGLKYFPEVYTETLVGLFLTVAPRMRDWEKRPVVYNIHAPVFPSGRAVPVQEILKIVRQTVSMYDPIPDDEEFDA